MKTPHVTNFDSLHALTFAFCLKFGIRPDCIKLDTTMFSKDLQKMLNGGEMDGQFLEQMISVTE